MGDGDCSQVFLLCIVGLGRNVVLGKEGRGVSEKTGDWAV